MPGVAESSAPGSSTGNGSRDESGPGRVAEAPTRAPPTRSVVAAHERVARLVGAPPPAAVPRIGCAHVAKPREGKCARRDRKAERVKAAAAEALGERAPVSAAAPSAGRRQRKVTGAGVGGPAERAIPAARASPALGRPKGDVGPDATPTQRQGTPTQRQGKSGELAQLHADGAQLRVVRLAPETKPRCRVGITKRGASAARLGLYCGAGTVGEFFDRHPGPERIARADLTNDLKKQLFETDPPLRSCNFRRMELDHAERARAVLAAAARGQAADARAATVSVVGPAGPGHELSDTELLGRLVAYEAIEKEPVQEWLAGALGPLGALVPDGAGDGFRGYEDVLMPADLCSAVELRRAAALEKLRGQDGKPFALESLHASYFADPALRENGEFGTVLTVGKGEASTPKAPPDLQAPIRSVAAAREPGEWDGPGGWREAAEDEIERVFVHFGSIKVVPASARRNAINEHGRGKVHTLHLVMPCKEKRNSDGEVTRKKVRITAADLVSNGRIASTFAANLEG